MIPQEFIDELLARTDIVEIVDARVKLKKTGQNYSGLCPFHTEKTPSFSVSADKQFYHCFGCKESGNALKFIMEFDRLEFPAAVELLAGHCGMEVPKDNNRQVSSEQQSRRKSIYELLDRSATFFKEQLRQHETRARAVDYLKGRGLSGEIARDFQLGYAPPGWDNLYSALAKTNQERQLLIDAGMLIEKEDSDRVYDRFRERIMFPIRDLRGRVIAFGGRILGDGTPKYLNSPETPVFHKGRELYGLYEARRRNHKLTYLLVVEGYMDVVALAQHGINTAVATLGTATTGDHLERLFRMVSRVIFSFDGDNAGRMAGWKALVTSLPHLKDGRSARFLFLPDGEDPDSLVRKEGRDAFLKRVDEAQNLADFFFDKLCAEVDMNALDGKAHLSKLAMPLIAQVPPGVFRELMIGKLSELTNLSGEKLLSLAAAEPERGHQRASLASSPPPEMAPPPDYGDLPPEPDEEDFPSDHEYLDGLPAIPAQPSALADRALSILLLQPELAAELGEDQLTDLDQDPGSQLLLNVARIILEEDIRTPALLLVRLQGESGFDHLRQLAGREQLLTVEHLPDEFRAVIGRLVRQQQVRQRAEQRRMLLAKPFSELSEAEKVRLVELSKNQSPGAG